MQRLLLELQKLPGTVSHYCVMGTSWRFFGKAQTWLLHTDHTRRLNW